MTMRNRTSWLVGRGSLGRVFLALVVLAAATSSYGEEAAEPRINLTMQGQGMQRGSAADGVVSHDEFAALTTRGEREKPVRSVAQKKLSAALSSAAQRQANLDFWFFDADVELFSDFDRDGYYFGIDLLFDVDTNFSVAEVYAVVYLSFEQGPWNEISETDDFTIFGASSDDEYVLVSELISGYPAGEYDMLIELYDTFDGSLVATFGPEDTSELALLPLEDSVRDAPEETRIVVSSGGGGAIAWSTLLALLAVTAGLRYVRTRH